MKRTGLEPRSALELTEESFCLLRAMPSSAWAAYALGSLPFLLGLLFFCSDMARSPFAEARLIPGASALALGFIWMKTWQAWFARHLAHRLAGVAPPQWSWRSLARSAFLQAVWQPLGLVLLPLAGLLCFPLAWAHAFFANVTVLSGEPNSPAELGKRAWRQTFLWPRQNHEILMVLALFMMLVFANWFAVVLAVPFLLDRFLGIESVFTRAPWAALNSTLTIAVAALTYLCCDPLHKAIYALRCFYGEALTTGQDLKAELRAVARPRPRARWSLFVLLAWPLFVAGGEPPSPKPAGPASPAPASVSAPDLQESIEQVIQQRQYSWRLPRAAQDARKTPRASWLNRFYESVASMAKSAARWMSDLMRWLWSLWNGRGIPAPSGSVLVVAIKGILLLLAAGLIALLGWLLYRLWRSRVARSIIVAEPIAPSPNVADENVGAEQLPGDEWLRLARELSQRGELRLALRALYLSTLAHLAERRWILLARFKSNRDYQRELARRGHALAEVLDLFSDNLAVFERVWYGLHPVDSDLLRQFEGHVERLKQA